MGRSVRNTRGISDSRDRALGDVKNELEHSKGDLRKSLSHPHSLSVLEAQPAALARHSPRDWQKTTPMCKFLPRLADFQLLLQARPVGALHQGGLAGGAQLAPDPDPAHREVLAAACRERRCSCTLLTLSSSGT